MTTTARITSQSHKSQTTDIGGLLSVCGSTSWHQVARFRVVFGACACQHQADKLGGHSKQKCAHCPWPRGRSSLKACTLAPYWRTTGIAGTRGCDIVGQGLHEFRLPGAAATAPRSPSLAKGAISGNQHSGRKQTAGQGTTTQTSGVKCACRESGPGHKHGGLV